MTRQEKEKTRSRSTTPHKSKPDHGSRRQNHVEFSPISSAPRRGSSANSGGGSITALHQQHHPRRESAEDREKQRRLEMVARARDRRETMLKRVRREKKIMLFSSMLAFVAQFVWFAAVFTDHWFYVIQTVDAHERALNSTHSGGLKSDNVAEIFLNSNTGLWKTCAHFQNLKTLTKRVQCSYFSIFLTTREEANRGQLPATLNEHVIEYTRAQICFASISVLLMTMTIISAFYTFKNSRYVYKRLAACLYFMTTISVLVVLEVLVTSVYYALDHNLYSEGAVVKYGFSFYMGWSVFLVYLVNGCIFLILSRKRKYDKDDGTDGGVIMGR